MVYSDVESVGSMDRKLTSGISTMSYPSDVFEIDEDAPMSSNTTTLFGTLIAVYLDSSRLVCYKPNAGEVYH